MFDIAIYISSLLVMILITKIFFLITERDVKASIQDEFTIDKIIEESNAILDARNSLIENKAVSYNLVETNKYLKMNEIISHYATLDVGCIDLQPQLMKPSKSASDNDEVDKEKLFEELESAPHEFTELIIRTNDNAKRLYKIKHPIKSKLYHFFIKIRSSWFAFNIFLIQQVLKAIDKIPDREKITSTEKLQKHLDENERKATISLFPLRDCLELAP